MSKKMIVFAVAGDEGDALKRFTKELDIDAELIEAQLGMDTVALTEGYEAVSVLGFDDVSRPVVEKLAANGVKYVALRSAGYNNVDVDAMREFNIRFSNATYSPNCVADYTVMHILMAIRKFKRTALKSASGNYSRSGIQGKEMHNLTIGIIGTGRIGATVARNLSGFGSKILGYDVYENDHLRDILEYTSLEQLIASSDVITLHTPLFKENVHMINAESIAKMKDGVVIINCARGELIDTDALVEALESGKVASAGLDVIENEVGIFHHDHSGDVLDNHDLSVLNGMNTVTVTPHMAFYTDQAVSDMVEVALRSLTSFVETGESQWEIKK